MRMSLSLGVVVVVLVAACAAEPPRQLGYAKYGATQEEFMKDRDDCLQQSRRPVLGTYVGTYGLAGGGTTAVNCGVMTACLDARGYAVDPMGNLDAPPGMGVSCVRG